MSHESSATISTDAQGNRFRLESIACPICKERNWKSIGMRGGAFDGRGRGIASEIVCCRNCELMWPDPFPYPVDPSELYGDPSKYFAHQNEDASLAHFRKHVIGPAIRFAGKASPSLLDVGSGRAGLLRAAAAEGITDMIGLEFAQGMIDYARDKHGIELIAKPVEKYAADAGRTFDVVTFSAVLEHVYDPDSAIEAAKKLTHRGSVLYIDVPQEPNLVSALVNTSYRLRRKRSVINLAPTFEPYHVFGFNKRSLGKLLEKHDFEIFQTRIHSDMNLPFPKTLKGRVLKTAGRALSHVANWTGTAINMFVWARRK
jgi:SAM-dependent methyltransferase